MKDGRRLLPYLLVERRSSVLDASKRKPPFEAASQGGNPRGIPRWSITFADEKRFRHRNGLRGRSLVDAGVERLRLLSQRRISPARAVAQTTLPDETGYLPFVLLGGMLAVAADGHSYRAKVGLITMRPSSHHWASTRRLILLAPCADKFKAEPSCRSVVIFVFKK
jgi:hypothetical protein